MKFLLFVACLFSLFSLQSAHAQRIYAPEITGSGHVQVDNERLVFVLTPDKIKKITPTEKQLHIELTEPAKEYFFTLTWLNRGKHLSVKSASGETISEGLIRREVDSGLIISKPINSRTELGRFMHRIRDGVKPIVIDTSIQNAQTPAPTNTTADAPNALTPVQSQAEYIKQQQAELVKSLENITIPNMPTAAEISASLIPMPVDDDAFEAEINAVETEESLLPAE